MDFISSHLSCIRNLPSSTESDHESNEDEPPDRGQIHSSGLIKLRVFAVMNPDRHCLSNTKVPGQDVNLQ